MYVCSTRQMGPPLSSIASLGTLGDMYEIFFSFCQNIFAALYDIDNEACHVYKISLGKFDLAVSGLYLA